MYHVLSSSAALAFLTNIIVKCKSASPNAIQVKICEIRHIKPTYWQSVMLDLLIVAYAQFVTKVKYSNFCNGLLQTKSAGGWGSQISRHVAHEGGQLVSPMYCPPLPPPPGSIPVTYFFQVLSWPLGHSVSCLIMSVKYFNATIRNWTHNQFLVQSEQTALLCAPQFMIMLIELNTVLCVEVKCLCNKTTTSFWEWTMPKILVLGFVHSCCIRNK